MSRCTCALSWGCSRTGTADNIINPIMSAAMRTPLSFSFTYGTVEVRAKMPSGDWIWPGEMWATAPSLSVRQQNSNIDTAFSELRR